MCCGKEAKHDDHTPVEENNFKVDRHEETSDTHDTKVEEHHEVRVEYHENPRIQEHRVEVKEHNGEEVRGSRPGHKVEVRHDVKVEKVHREGFKEPSHHQIKEKVHNLKVERNHSKGQEKKRKPTYSYVEKKEVRHRASIRHTDDDLLQLHK